MIRSLTLALSRNRIITALAFLLVGIAGIDFYSGSEIRVYPFYFIPIALAAINLDGKAAKLTAMICAALWAVSNYGAGPHWSSHLIWVWNVAIHGAAFQLVALLVSGLKESKLREIDLARSDWLTGLPNTQAFHEQAPQLLAFCRRAAHPVVMAYIDLDNFKAVNDSFGHQRGDDVLRIASQAMKATLRTSDLLARLGGDEFAVLLPNATPEQARETLERLREAIAASMRAAGCDVTASIGAVSYLNTPSLLDELIAAADAVMYEVKESGKNFVQVKKY
ncbi:putative Diguanylate cyclase [Candidatus Propionivibrio aalborgensis]|uniref:diguanylate cyclase n=1 Tax=Candidatus Propionivibrio aalborgensis TaxID=1860101 RepID=A0A1A8XZZ1_9RHOO|nr:GGDEF domain-containing protein [Candidatus Propionivibrio aalborgensis]SBT10509.1 putative Diguanylate cyclase [Candidatus Propionivibrio aalborgensis]